MDNILTVPKRVVYFNIFHMQGGKAWDHVNYELLRKLIEIKIQKL
jgi:hypothetical protein